MPIGFTSLNTLRMKTILLIAFCIITGLANLRALQDLITFSLKSEYATYVPFIPVISLVLIMRKRRAIFADQGSSPAIGGIVLLAGLGILVAKIVGYGIARAEAVSFTMAGLLFLWIGAFILAYGFRAFREALFPLLFLFFMIPIPDFVLQNAIVFLQRGSAECAALLFSLTGTPFHRQDMAFMLPRINIEVAEQCSGIRSSLAVLISSLLAGHLILRTAWRKLAFVLIAIPVMMFKNGVRIAVLSLLAIHVDERWLTGSDLHREGGILFFTLALLLLWPVLWALKWSEKRSSKGKVPCSSAPANAQIAESSSE